MALFRQSSSGGSSALSKVICLYLAVFFVWLLPIHVLSHEVGTYSTKQVLSLPGSAGPHASHDPDNCQLCRSQGQLGAFPQYCSFPLVANVLAEYVESPLTIPASVPDDFASLRAPPARS